MHTFEWIETAVFMCQKYVVCVKSNTPPMLFGQCILGMVSLLHAVWDHLLQTNKSRDSPSVTKSAVGIVGGVAQCSIAMRTVTSRWAVRVRTL